MRKAEPGEIPEIAQELRQSGYSDEEIGLRVIRHFQTRGEGMDDAPYRIMTDEDTYEIQGTQTTGE